MKISQMVFNLDNGHKYKLEMAMFNVQRAITKSRQIRVTFHEFCTSTHGALNLRDFSSKYPKWFSTYRADTSTW